MADSCYKCGKGFSGMFGVTPVGPQSIETIKNTLGVDYSGLCIQCATPLLNKERALRLSEGSASIKARMEKELEAALDKMTIQTVPHFESLKGEVLGVVSGYSVIGTGVISEFFSSFSDFFGIESQSYLKKIRKGEKSAIFIAKMQALEMGADMISGFTISVAEATSGHGMIMITCSGTAVKTQDHTPISDDVKKLEEAILLENLSVTME